MYEWSNVWKERDKKDGLLGGPTCPIHNPVKIKCIISSYVVVVLSSRKWTQSMTKKNDAWERHMDTSKYFDESLCQLTKEQRILLLT